MVTGRNDAAESRDVNHRLVRAFLAQCETRFGSTNCERLIGCRLDTPEGQQFFQDHHLREKCAGLTKEAARLASQLLEPSPLTVPPSP